MTDTEIALTFLSRMVRDALVEKIWEGTANIMALDVVRACCDGRSGIAFVDVSSTFHISTHSHVLGSTLNNH
jgi:hypothetical protein